MPVGKKHVDEKTLLVFIPGLAARLQDEGAKSFVNSWNELMSVIESKSDLLKKPNS